MYTHVRYANDFMEMLLFQGIAEMAGREEKSRYELLEISDPSTLLVRGKDFYNCTLVVKSICYTHSTCLSHRIP